MKDHNHIPPKLGTKFLEWFLKADLAEEVLGDLEEKYLISRENHSPFRANLNYWYQVLNYLRPFALKHIHVLPSNFFFMWRHNLKITLRFYLKNKVAFLINLIGLSSGLACAMFIYLWVMDELSFDQFHSQENPPYQVMRNFHGDHEIGTGVFNPGALANAMAEDFPEVKYAASASVFAKQTRTLTVDNKSFKAEGCFAGKDIFHILSFELISGDIDQLLNTDEDIVISSSVAEKLFGRAEDALGKMLKIDPKSDFMVTGVFKDAPDNSSVQFEYAFSHDAFAKQYESMRSWTNYNINTFLTMEDGTDIDQFNKKIENYLKGKSPHKHSTIFIRPLADAYLFGKYENGVQAGGRISYVKLFTLLALFILLVACINFMNLSTAKASKRLQEVGVKKVIGASRGSLIHQYLSESILLATLSLLVAFGLVAMFLPQFNQVTGKHISLNMSLAFIATMVLITGITGVLAGSYPAFFLSSFQPIAILRTRLKGSPGGLNLRKGLVVFQFALSVILMIGVGVISSQMDLIQTKNLGYERENVVEFSVEGNPKDSVVNMLSAVKSIPGVTQAAGTRVGFYSFYSTIEIEWEGKLPDEMLDIQYRLVDYDFIETMGIEMVEGHAFSREFGTDKSGIVLNETAIKSMRLSDPIGEPINVWGYDFQVIGVAKDFNFRSLHSEIEPLFFIINDEPRSIYAKIASGKEKEVIEQLQNMYEAFNPGFVFDYQFLDTYYQSMYESEMRTSTLARYFAVLAVLISCLGLLGLATFTAETRTKEIGIRKVLGANAWGIMTLLSKEFTQMVLIGIGIAIPISYFFAKNWLEGFAYQIDLTWEYFVFAGLVALLISWVTVASQAYRAALSNPVTSLRSE